MENVKESKHPHGNAIVEPKEREQVNYPDEFVVSPGQGLRATADELANIYGARIIVICRDQESLSAVLAPIKIIDLGIWGRCTKPVKVSVLRARGLFDLVGTELDNADTTTDAEVLVCTPPVSGAQARLVCKMFLEEETLASDVVSQLEALDATCAYEERLAGRILRPYLCQIEYESSRWNAAVKNAARRVENEPILQEYDASQPATAENLTSRIKTWAVRSSFSIAPLLPKQASEEEKAAIVRMGEIIDQAGDRVNFGWLMGIVGSNPRFCAWYAKHISELAAHFKVPEKTICSAPDASAVGGADKMSPLDLLVEEEKAQFTRLREKWSPNPDSPFVFTFVQARAYLEKETARMIVDNEARAKDRLNRYVGGYLHRLDLGRSAITGSAIAAALFVTHVEGRYSGCEEYYQSLYPTIYTRIPPGEGLGHYRTMFKTMLPHPHGTKIEVRAVSRQSVILTFVPSGGDPSISLNFDVEPGADVDIAVLPKPGESFTSDEDFDEIAKKHYRAIVQYYNERETAPKWGKYLVLEKDNKDLGRYTWHIRVGAGETGEEFLQAAHMFREVEIFRNGFSNICTYHLPQVRGCYTAALSLDQEVLSALPGDLLLESRANTPQRKNRATFYVTASLVKLAASHIIPFYNYFAGRKSMPHEIVLKNEQRGFPLRGLPRSLYCGLEMFTNNCDKWRGRNNNRRSGGYGGKAGWHHLLAAPAYYLCGNFNIYALDTERERFG